MGTLARGTLIQLLGGNTMTARRKAKRAGHSAWVGVVSLDPPKVAYLNSVDPSALGQLQVQAFEIPDDALKYEDVGEDETVELERFTVAGVEELEALLVRLEIDPSTLAFKADTGYPL